MTSRKMGLGILVLVLVFGMMVVGCGDDDATDDVSLDGTWVNVDNDEKIIFSGSKYTCQGRDTPSDKWENEQKGTFSLNAAKTKITFNCTHQWDDDDGKWSDYNYTWSADIDITNNRFELVYEGAGYGWEDTYKKSKIAKW